MGKLLKNNNLIYIITIAALIVLIVLVTNRHPFGRRQSSFAVSTSTVISKVEFSQNDETLTLERDDSGRWYVNGKHEARTNGISFIEKILTGMEIKSPVTEETFFTEIISPEVEPVKVRLFDKQKVVKMFFVYKTNSNTYGNIMKTTLRAKPFIVWVPGYDSNIGSAFTLNENYWRPYTIFNLLPSDIQAITLENNADSTSSFKLVNNIATGQQTVFPSMSVSDDSLKINRYLSYYSMVPFESWALDLSQTRVEEITGRAPLFNLTVNRRTGENINITFWPLEREGVIDTDRLWARIDDNKNLVVVRYFDIDPIIKRRSYFYIEQNSLID